MKKEVKTAVKSFLLSTVNRPQSREWCDDFLKGYAGTAGTGNSVDDEFVDWLYREYGGSQ